MDKVDFCAEVTLNVQTVCSIWSDVMSHVEYFFLKIVGNESFTRLLIWYKQPKGAKGARKML